MNRGEYDRFMMCGVPRLTRMAIHWSATNNSGVLQLKSLDHVSLFCVCPIVVSISFFIAVDFRVRSACHVTMVVPEIIHVYESKKEKCGNCW